MERRRIFGSEYAFENFKEFDDFETESDKMYAMIEAEADGYMNSPGPGSDYRRSNGRFYFITGSGNIAAFFNIFGLAVGVTFVVPI